MALAHLSNDTVRFTAFLFTMAITFVSMSEFNLFKCSHFLNSFELLGNRKKPALIFTIIVFTISCKTYNRRCQRKQMHGNYFRITTAPCYLTAVIRIHV